MRSDPVKLGATSGLELPGQISGQSPFLDSSHLLGVDIDVARQQALRAEANVARNMSFDDFKQKFIAGQSDIGRLVLSFGERTPLNESWQSIDISTEYVLRLRGSSFPGAHLKAHYQRFVDYNALALAESDPDLYVSGPHLAMTLVQPLLRWMSGTNKSRSVARDIAIMLESTHADICRQVTQERCSPARLEYLNAVTYAYFVAVQVLAIGCAAPLVCNYLLVHRLASAHAWAEVPERVRLQHAALSLHLMTAFFLLDEPYRARYGFSLNTLADFRSVVSNAAQATNNGTILTHVWAFEWVRDKLDSEVFSTRRPAAGLSALSEAEHLAVVELARRFGSYRYPVTVDHLATFLTQFQSTQRIRAALRLLSHTKFFPLWELAEAIQGLLTPHAANGRKIVVAPSGDRTGSTAIINYLASHSQLASQIVFAQDIVEALNLTKRGQSIFFIDDCLLSGTQTLSVLGDLMGTRKLKPHHTRYCDALPPRQRNQLTERALRFEFCVATDFGLERLNCELPDTGLDPELVSFTPATIDSIRSKTFEPMGPVGWLSSDERDDLKQFLAEVGYDLLGPRAARKDWTDNRRRESALGFSDLQRLLVFPYNVPKSTLTPLWEKGTEKRRWIPLFPGAD